MVANGSASGPSPLGALSLYYTTDPGLSDAPILVFTGAAQSSGVSSQVSSRVQSHVISPAGLVSFSRLAISPSSSLYNAVTCLSQHDQGDEVCRILAYSVMKYFAELPNITKQEWARQSRSKEQLSSAPCLFSDAHAAALAGRMLKITDSQDIALQIQPLFDPQPSITLDVDLVLPNSTLTKLQTDIAEGLALDQSQDDYEGLISKFGEAGFIPTEKVRRAPSRPLQKTRGYAFRKEQKEALRREICELLDTEESFVVKLDKLVHEYAVALISNNHAMSRSTHAKENVDLHKLFPESLDRILAVNTGFLNQLLAIVEESEADAIADLEQDNGPSVEEDVHKDPTGASDVARCFLEWLPKFKDCYSSYIKAHSEFSSILKRLMSPGSSSSLVQKIQDIGEQRLLSMLIEPVQRLPRYSLYLENLMSQLPQRHPALSLFLKAKDLVADACAHDSPFGRRQKANDALKRLIPSWPSDLLPASRLITAVDLQETGRRYDSPANYIGLLFATHFALVSKKYEECLSARGILAEVEGGDANLESTRQSEQVRFLVFEDCVSLRSINAVGLSHGTILRFLPRCPSHSPVGNSLCTAIRSFVIGGSYAERAERFVNEFVLARTEERFPERVRDGKGWEVRQTESSISRLCLVTAVLEDGGSYSSRTSAAEVEITVDLPPFPTTHRQSNGGASIAAAVVCEGNGFYRIEIGSLNTQKTRDVVTLAEFMPVLFKRLSSLVQSQVSLRTSSATCCFIQHYTSCLGSLPLPRPQDTQIASRSKPPRSHSPVKALTNLFGGSAKEVGGNRKSPPLAEPAKLVTIMRPQLGPRQRSEPKPTSELDESAPKLVMVGSDNQIGPNSIEELEQCLANYLLALRARKGNVVGRVISSRHNADPAMVSRLNSAVMEQPENNEVAANEAVDVLFAAFEEFLRTIWGPRLGPVLDTPFLDDLQSQFTTLSPLDYEEYLNLRLADIGPQNRRAFKAILATFVDLLDGMSGDSDKGALMVTLAEMLICQGRPLDYIPLFDRFVEEYDVILIDELQSGHDALYQGSLASSTATRSTHAGSMSSKASSLRRRIGVHPMTDSVKSGDSKLSSVFRSLSKASRSGDGSLRGKSRPHSPVSAEPSAKSTPHSRPGSRGRIFASGRAEDIDPRPGTGLSWNEAERAELLQVKVDQWTGSPKRKKRRSSLSDLESLPLPNTSPFWDAGTPSSRKPVQEASPLAPHGFLTSRNLASKLQPQYFDEHGQKDQSKALRRGATVNHGELNAGQHSLSTPPTRVNRKRFRSQNSPNKKENLSSMTSERSFDLNAACGPIRGILSERPGSDNTPLAGSSTEDYEGELPRSKARINSKISRSNATDIISPRTLLEQVQMQGSAVFEAEVGLKTELAKISEELAALNMTSSPSPLKQRVTALEAMSEGIPTPGKTSATLQNISGRLKALETKLPHLISNLTRRVEALRQDIERTLILSDSGSEYISATRTQPAQQTPHRPQEIGIDKRLREAYEEADRWRAECSHLRKENRTLQLRLSEK